MARVSQRSFHPNYLGYKVRTTTVVARNFKKKISSNILAGFKLHTERRERRKKITRREYHAWGIHGPSIAISNQAHCRRNMTVPGDQPRHLQNYPISTNSNNSTTPLSSELSCRDGNFRWGNNQFFFSCLEGTGHHYSHPTKRGSG